MNLKLTRGGKGGRLLITNPSSRQSYEVGKLVAETERYRLYLCRPEGVMKDHLLQVATSVEHNGVLDRSAFILGRLLDEAQRTEDEYARVTGDPKRLLNYQLSFPEVADTFLLADQGNRRVTVLRFRGVDDVRNVVPLHNLVHRDRLRVDMRTSVWIMGKLLKILTFFHSSHVEVGNLSLGNILIEPDLHYVIIFNWADAQMKTGKVERGKVREDVQAVAQAVIHALGGSLEGGIPNDGSEEHVRYEQHLITLAKNGESDAQVAHGEFYALVDSLWKRGFYKFTTHPR